MTDLQQNKMQKKLDANQIIDEILEYTGLKPAQFLRKIGANLTTVTDIRNGKTKTISRKLAAKIIAQYPQISENFLVLGIPPMLVGDNSNQTNVGDHNSNSGNITNVDERLLDMLEKNQEERLKLLTIIENLTSK